MQQRDGPCALTYGEQNREQVEKQSAAIKGWDGMQPGSSTNEGGLLHSVEKAAAASPRAGTMMIATTERVGNTRRIIAQSRQLLDRTREMLESSRSLRLRRSAAQK